MVTFSAESVIEKRVISLRNCKQTRAASEQVDLQQLPETKACRYALLKEYYRIKYVEQGCKKKHGDAMCN